MQRISSRLDINSDNTSTRDITSNDGSFVILTDEILETEVDSLFTYTFRIETPTDSLSSFENFVIEEVDSTYQFWIFRYRYDTNYSEQFPYEMTSQNVEEDEINLGDFDDYLNNRYSYVDGCIYYIEASDLMDSGWLSPILVWCNDGGAGTFYNGFGASAGITAGDPTDSSDPNIPHDETGDYANPPQNDPGGTDTNADTNGAENTGVAILTPDYQQIITTCLGVPEGLPFDYNIWLNANSAREDKPNIVAIAQLLLNNFCSQDVQDIIGSLMDTDFNGQEVNFEELFIETPTPDDSYNYTGPIQLIPTTLNLPNGDQVNVTFGTTKSDNTNANQQVSNDLVDAIIFALNQANNTLPAVDKITSIYVMATTNGSHSATSNHTNGTAIDISRINGVKMVLGLTNQIIEVQNAFDNFIYIRENFGPHFKHKYDISTNTWNYNHAVGGHQDHIHVSVRR